MSRSGADLALLLLGSYRRLVTAVQDELATHGHPDVRPTHEFAMRVIDGGAHNATDLAKRTGVTKQAAAKTIATLEQHGYVTTARDPRDARRKHLSVTPLGHEVMHLGERIFDDLRSQLERQIGADALASLEANLHTIVGDAPIRVDAPGWNPSAE